MCLLLFQVPAGNDGQAAARVPPDRPPDILAPADQLEAENLGDEAGLDDDEDDDDVEEEEEVRVEDGNPGGQGEWRSDSVEAGASPGQNQSLTWLTGASLGFVEDLNWNALEWDRAAEELTWERVGILSSSCLCRDVGGRVRRKAMVALSSFQPFGLCVMLLFVSVPDVGSGWLLGVLGECRLVRFPVCLQRVCKSQQSPVGRGWRLHSSRKPALNVAGNSWMVFKRKWLTQVCVRLLGTRVLGGVSEHALHPGLW